MAYFRGEYYIYASKDFMNFHTPTLDGSLPHVVFDALALMRVAQLMVADDLEHDADALAAAVDLAMEQAGNFGQLALNKALGAEDWWADLVAQMEVLRRDEGPTTT